MGPTTAGTAPWRRRNALQADPRTSVPDDIMTRDVAPCNAGFEVVSGDRSIRADIDDDRMSGGLAGSHSAASLVNSSRGAGPRGPLPSWPPPSAAKGGTNNIMQRDAHRKGGVEDKSRANHVVRPTLQQQQPARHCSRSIRIHYQTWCKAACFLWHRGRHHACRATRGAQLSPGLQ